MNKYLFMIYMDAIGFWRWRLKERKGRRRIIADSGEGYSTKSNARRAVNRLLNILDVGDYDIG